MQGRASALPCPSMRAFVVGNGPSLKDTPLDLLSDEVSVDEVSYACNNIHLMYPHTKWRPTHYVRAEAAHGLEVEHWKDSMEAHLALDVDIFCNAYFFKEQFGLNSTDRVHTFKACAHYARHFDNENSPHLWHLPILCTFGSSVNVAVQLAVQAGHGPIYLVGCDLGYKDGQPSHFDENYAHGREQSAQYANMDTLAAHMIAARSSDVEIFNATIGGELEVYPRVEFESLF